VVVHAAGKAHSTPTTKKEADKFYEVNFTGTKNLCTALQKQNRIPRALIFISTVAVYGKDEGLSISENNPLMGSTPYAESKILAEDWLSTWSKLNGVKLTVLRLPLIAGLNPPGNLGAMINGIRSGLYFSIGKGNAKKSMVWSEDVANVLPTVAAVGGTFNLTDGYNPTFKELEKVIYESINKREPIAISLKTAELLGKLGDLFGNKAPLNTDKVRKIVSNLTFDDTLARSTFDWKPSSVIEHFKQVL